MLLFLFVTNLADKKFHKNVFVKYPQITPYGLPRSLTSMSELACFLTPRLKFEVVLALCVSVLSQPYLYFQIDLLSDDRTDESKQATENKEENMNGLRGIFKR